MRNIQNKCNTEIAKLRHDHCQVTSIYIALLTIQIVSKHLTVLSWRIECQSCIIIRLNTQFSVKGIPLDSKMLTESEKTGGEEKIR